MKQKFEISGEQELEECEIKDFSGRDRVVIKNINVNGRECDLVLRGRDEGFHVDVIEKNGRESMVLSMGCYSGSIKFFKDYDDGDSFYSTTESYSKELLIDKGKGKIRWGDSYDYIYKENVEDLEIEVPQLYLGGE